MSGHLESIADVLGRGPVHPFPARMAPGIALRALEKGVAPLRVLDPMMGSGTVLALARSKQHRAIGIDIDPLSVLIARVWTTAVSIDDAKAAADEVLQQAKIVFKFLSIRDAYPHASNAETREFIRYWFDGYARRQLASLASSIMRISNMTIRDVLWCAFSRLIVTKQSGASLAMDLAHSRPHKTYRHAPAKPFNRFLFAVDRVVAGCIHAGSVHRGPPTTTKRGDARHLPFPTSSIDLVLTSPPYLNAIDYFRCSKFPLVWMGHNLDELRQLRSVSVGTEVGTCSPRWIEGAVDIIDSLRLEPALSTRQRSILTRYIDDMGRSIAEVARVLKPGGQAIYVVGENTLRGTFISNSRIVEILGTTAGLKVGNISGRDLPNNRRYLPPPTSRGGSLDNRMRREVLITFDK